jgi:hypothetical protein
MSTPSPLVWFLLLDAATGEPYKGTTADYVSLPPVYVIAQFRDAVQLKYDKPYYLKDIPSSALLVYKNKAAFDKRNAATDEEKVEPLEEDSVLDGLGSSKKKPSLSPFRRQEAPVEAPPNPVSSEKSRIPKESSDG